LTLDELMSRPIIGGCLRPNSVSRKLTASLFQRRKQARWSVNKLLRC
jgi:hypothetical protein